MSQSRDVKHIVAQANNYVLFSVFDLTKEWPGNEIVSPLLGLFRHHDPSLFSCAHSQYRNAIELVTTCCSGRTFLFFLGYFFFLFALLKFKLKSVDYSHEWFDASSFCCVLMSPWSVH